MPLPTRVKYQAAVQNPRINFRDPELVNSKAECTTNGMPATYSGGFATTFRMRNSGFEWAVRCFTSPVDQLEKRYGIIGRYIAKYKPAFLVGAKLQSHGILIDADWYPIVKMQWLKGSPLNAYIGRQLSNPSGLHRKTMSLRRKLLELADAMERAGIAHGDLQHGNLLVNSGGLRLVDYDGMFLPRLKGMDPDEVGHKHYQHPQRAREDWGPGMDRFSLIALYVGLSAIAERPDLWKKFNNDENVLFTKSDFAKPEASELFEELRSIGALEKMSEVFRELCAGPLRSVPKLDRFIALSAPFKSNGGRKGKKLDSSADDSNSNGMMKPRKRERPVTESPGAGEGYHSPWENGILYLLTMLGRILLICIGFGVLWLVLFSVVGIGVGV